MIQVNINATVKKIKYYDELTDWSVIQFIDNANGKLFIATGNLGSQIAGYELLLTGRWVNNTKGKGQQFNVTHFFVEPPKTSEGIYLFLTSGLFKGFSKQIVRRLIDTYGEQTLKLLDSNINIINTVKGVGPATFIKIRDSYEETIPQQQKILALINEIGFTFNEALMIVTEFQLDPITQLREAPYSMCWRLKKIPFIRFDCVVMGLNDFSHAPQRIREVILHQIKSGSRFGHTVASYNEVLNGAIIYLKIDGYLVVNEINYLCSKRRISLLQTDNGWVIQLMWLYSAEKEVSTRLALIGQTPAEKELIFNPDDPRLVKLKEQQAAAIVAPFKHKVSIITGRPGTGKTTMLKTMCDLLISQNLSVLGVSPTGKAAQRLSEVTGQLCSTLHRALGSTHKVDKYTYNDLNPIRVDVVVIDEMSMLDIIMMRAFLRAIPYTSRLIFVGDVDQLPSVDLGAVYRDLIDSQRIAVFWLTKVLRIKRDDGSIPTPLLVSEQIRLGRCSFPPNDDEWVFIETNSNNQSKKVLVDVINQLKTQEISCNDVQVFSALNQNEVGVDQLNILIKKAFHPTGENFIELNDKVMQKENNYDLMTFNGDIGVVKKVYSQKVRSKDSDPALLVNMSGRDLIYSVKSVNELILAYAITGHKSQGSEYPYVIIVLPDHLFSLMDRYWLYTLMTRCQKKVYLIGNKQVVHGIIRSRRSHNRKTLLKEQLCRFLPSLS